MWEGAGEPVNESVINETGEKPRKKCPHCGQPMVKKSRSWGNSEEECSGLNCPGKKKEGIGWGK